jgi:hypothetical protein
MRLALIPTNLPTPVGMIPTDVVKYKRADWKNGPADVMKVVDGPPEIPRMGTRKSLSPEQRAEAAQPFDAEGQYLSVGKKLLDTRHLAFKTVTAVKTRIANTWKSMSLPFPEPGVRLIRRDEIEEFVSLMEGYRNELVDAVANLDRHYGELKVTAAERLGRLFNPGDYPESLIGLFDVQGYQATVDWPGCNFYQGRRSTPRQAA